MCLIQDELHFDRGTKVNCGLIKFDQFAFRRELWDGGYMRWKIETFHSVHISRKQRM